MRHFTPALAACGTLAAVNLLLAAPHPLHDDGGAVNWRATWAAALDASRRTGKPIFVDAGLEH